MTERTHSTIGLLLIVFAVGCYVGWVGHAGAWEWLMGQWELLNGGGK